MTPARRGSAACTAPAITSAIDTSKFRIVPSRDIRSEIERGSIVVDVVSPAANKAIWRGSAAAKINRENNLEKRVARVNEVVAKMFEKFPVPPAKR